MFRYIACILVVMVSLTARAEEKIYLLGAFNYKGTPITLAGLFYDPKVKDLETCKAYIRQLKGIYGEERMILYRALEAPQRSGVYIFKYYRCIQDDMTVSRWNERDFYRYVYRVDLRDGYSFTRFDNLDKCWKSMRKDPQKHTSKLFCAKLNQRLAFN